MSEYELHKIRSAELIRAAAAERLAREARAGRRAAARAARTNDPHDPGSQVSTATALKRRFIRAA